MICIRSLNGSSASIGSGSLALASEPLAFIPPGMQVAGSKPWFCKKKITRFIGEAVEPIPKVWFGRKPPPTAAPKPAAKLCNMLLRFIFLRLIAEEDDFIHIFIVFFMKANCAENQTQGTGVIKVGAKKLQAFPSWCFSMSKSMIRVGTCL